MEYSIAFYSNCYYLFTYLLNVINSNIHAHMVDYVKFVTFYIDVLSEKLVT